MKTLKQRQDELNRIHYDYKRTLYDRVYNNGIRAGIIIGVTTTVMIGGLTYIFINLIS